MMPSGQRTEDLEQLDDLDAPAPPDPGQEAEGGMQARTEAQYTGPEQRCAMCNRFDGEGQCSLGWPAEPEGHCIRFEAAGGGEGEETAEDALPQSDPDADLEALEELR